MESGSGTGMQKYFHEENDEGGSKRPRVIPVNGLKAGNIPALQSDK